MRRACCIIGAGYSYVAGLPLTRDLFSTDVDVVSDAAGYRFRAVWEDYRRWQDENPPQNPEEYLADLYGNILRRLAPRFTWAVELIAAVLATPRGPDLRPISPRYGVRVINPSHCAAHANFWRVVMSPFDEVGVVTTNYDLFVERSLRHRPMRRGFGPGCYYGGLPRPQLLIGTTLPFSVLKPERWVELTGAVPIYKLHGSLNWSKAKDGLETYQDLRPAFRHGGDAAIVPPVLEKDVPPWLRPIWSGAEKTLSEAECWIVCGYSLPTYDVAVNQLLRRAAEGRVKHIFVLDPNGSDLHHRYLSIAPRSEVHCLRGLPRGTSELQDTLEAMRG